jgi:lysozyme
MPYIWDPGALRARWVEDAPRPPKPAPAATTPKPGGPAKVPTKGALAALVGAAVAATLAVMVPNFEGTRLVGYLDPVGIPTKCMGDTTNVVVGYRYTEAECRTSLETQLLAHAAPVLTCVPALAGRDNQLAASVSFAYNIGTGAFCKSTAARRFSAGTQVSTGAAWASSCVSRLVRHSASV